MHLPREEHAEEKARKSIIQSEANSKAGEKGN